MSRNPQVDRTATFIFLALAVTFTALTAVSWARWGHVRIDTGGAIYRAASIADGAVLYRDILVHYGPVAPYAVGTLLRLVGIHMNAIYLLGLTFVLAESSLLWFISRRIVSNVEAATAVVAFWILLAFQPGLFNWIVPNVFASTFAVLFATAALALLVLDLSYPRARNLVLASLCTALAGLSKVEHGGAVLLTLLLYVLLLRSAESRGRSLAHALLPGGVLTCIVAVAVVASVPWHEVVFDNVYRVRSLTGTLDAYQDRLFPPLLPSLSRAALHYLIELPLLATAIGWGWVLLHRQGAQRLLGIGLIGLGLLLPLFAPSALMNPDMVRSVLRQHQFVWTGVAWGGLALWGLVRWRGEDQPLGNRVLTVIAIFAFLDTLRWGFRVAWAPYYAVFAPLLVLVLVRSVARRVLPTPSAWPVVLVLLVAVAPAALRHGQEFQARSFSLTYPRGTIRTTPSEGRPMKAVIDYLRQETDPGDYVAVLPEEQMINFLAETKHPTRDTGIGPGWLANRADVERFLAELGSDRTRFVVTSGRRYAEFGATKGALEGPRIAGFLESNYGTVFSAGRYRVLRPTSPAP
ncbi:MAG: hypothetical protein P8R42_19680 [Candidatus Binatia bacterium]|nr:hypothetical protein [Candidatus Binatia bacterium]